jgi:hypothetical protein
MTAKYKIFFIAQFLLAIAGCSTPSPLWHLEASQIVQSVRAEGNNSILQSEYSSLVNAFDKGECLLLSDDVVEADQLFKLVILKGELLRQNLAAEKSRQAELERLRRLEQEKLEKDRLEALARDKEKRRLEAEEVLARIAEQAKREIEAEALRAAQRLKIQKEKVQLVASHTVKRGETLPLIAALPEVYNDSQLWPLIFRANRDQIRNPQNLWPGQTLRIPRNNSRDDIIEARRYAQDKRQH